MSYEVAQVLQDAAAVIERDGWCQGDYRTPLGHCSVGAINVALGLEFNSGVGHAHLAYQSILGVIDQPLVTTWNDHPDRTKQEVIDAFHLAAKQEMRKADGLL